MATASADTSFLSTVGINTSITMIGSAYQNYAQMMNALSYIGVNQVRDTYDNPYTTAEFALMAKQLNLKFDFFIALGSASPEWQIAQIKTNPTIVSYVEGYNESDSWWQSFHGATGVAATQAVQQYIYAAVKSAPTLSGVGVIQATFISPSSFTAYGDMSAYTDYASTHTYSGTGNPPSGSAPLLIAQSQTISPNRPTITTEAGYHTTLGSVHGVSQLVQAKYELDLLFEQAKAGVKLTYLWELADNYADPGNTNSEDHFGIFNNDWTPKLAAIALHNTMQIMADPGTGGVAPGILNYSFGSLPSSVQSSLYQKSDGTFVLVVWNDVRLSGPTVQQDIVVAPIATTLQLGQQFASVAIFDPLTGTSTIQQFSGVSSIALQVVDHPLIIELSQNPAFPSASSTIAAPSQVITNPLSSVNIDGLSVASASTDTITVQVQSTASGLSVLDTAGHLLASNTNSITLTGSAAVINAELATLAYTGGNAFGSDTITVTAIGGSGLLATTSIPVLVMAGTTATNSGGLALSVPASFSSVVGSSLILPRVSVVGAYAATHSGNLTMTINATSGTLQVPAGAATVTGNASSSLIIIGSLAQITAALNALNYTAAAQAGQDVITYRAVDQTGFASTGTTTVSVAASTTTIAPAVTPAAVVVATPTAIVATTTTPTTVAATTPTVVATTTPATVAVTTPTVAAVTTPTIVADTTPPSLTVSQSVSGTTTSTSNTLSGTVSDSGSGVAAVEIFINSAGVTTDVGTATLNGSTWSRTISNLAAGTYKFYAVGFDKAGNTTVAISTGAAQTIVAQAVGTTAAIPVAVTTPTVAATTIPATVAVTTPTVAAATTPTTVATVTPTTTAAATTPTISASTTSAVAPVSTPVPVADTTPPSLTVGQSVSGTTTSTSNILSGTVSDSGSGVAAVEIFINSAGVTTDIGTATLNGNAWSRTISGLAPGTYSFYAVGFDKAGNATAAISTGPAETVVSPTPTIVAPTVDTTAPTLTVAQSLSGTTTSTSNALSGTVSDSGSGVAAVEIFINSAGVTTDLGTATLNGSTWNRTISGLALGTYNFYAVGFDKAGNATAAISTGPAQTIVAPIVDNTAPTLTATQSLSGTTTSSSNTLSGTVSDSGSGVAAVEIFISSAGKSTDIGTATLDGGTWSRTISNLATGTYKFYAVGFDKAGNSTAPISTGPSETIVAPAQASAAANSDSVLYRFFDSTTGAQFLTASAAERDAVIATRPDLVPEGVGISIVSQPADDPDAVAIYRFFDTTSGTHFYTSSSTERDDLVANRSDLTFEGTSFYEHQNAEAGDTPVYRFFNQVNGTHFYTASESERAAIIATRPDMTAEGISFYAPGTTSA